jgi:superfamily II DNA or RNA helicase
VDATFDLDAFPRRCPRKGCGGTIPATGLRPGPVHWTRTLSAWSTSDALRDALSEILDWAVVAGRTTLVLVPRVETARALASEFTGRGIRSAALTGAQADASRRVSDLRRGRIAVLFGTSIADEALDVPEVDLVVIASLGKAKGTHEQRAGRSTRPSGHRTPIVVDLVPDGVAWQWPARRRSFVGAFGGDVPEDPMPAPVALARMATLHRG